MMKNVFAIVVFFSFLIPLAGKMIGWKFFKDREGNSYYIDSAGKIFVTGNKKFKYKTVSLKGVVFHYNNALNLVKRGSYKEGLQILKSILAIPSDNNRLFIIQSKAAKKIKELKAKQGSRFYFYDRDASFLFYKKNGNNFLVNDFMFYKVKIPGTVEVLSAKRRYNFKRTYSGITLGIKLKGSKFNSKFDMLLAIDSEKLIYRFSNIKELNRNWSINLGDEKVVRKIIITTKNMEMRSFLSRVKPVYAGYEGVYFNKNYSYYVRIISPEKYFLKNRKIMKEIISAFKPVML